MLSFSLANNTGFGQYAKTTFFEIKCFSKGAEGVKPYLTKGKQVAVTGTINLNTWSPDGANTGEKLELTCFDVVLLGGGAAAEAPTAKPAAYKMTSPRPNVYNLEPTVEPISAEEDMAAF
jgi:single-strand DNA-binding protein